MKIDPSISNDELRRGLFTGMRVIPPPELLDPDLRQKIEGQTHILCWVVAAICSAARAPVPISILDAHKTVPPGWWFSPHELGITTARGVVSMVAHGIEGPPLGYTLGDGLDHRRQGIDAMGFAILALHEASHAAHHLLIGFDASAAALMDPTRKPGIEIDGFRQFVALVHQRVTGAALPSGYDASRWPLGAPGLSGWLEGLAAAVLPFAVEPAPAQRPCSEADWIEAQRLSFSEDLNNLMAERAAAARWRAACAEPAP